GKWTAEQMAQVALDSFAVAQRTDSEKPAKTIDELLARPYFADPLRRHDIAPITDGASAIVLAAGDKARERRRHPARKTGFQPPTRVPGGGRAGPGVLAVHGGVGPGCDGRRHRLHRGGRDLRAVPPSAPDPDRGDRPWGVDEGEPVRGRAGGQPDVLRRPRAHRLRRAAHLQRLGATGASARHEWPGAATEFGGGPGRKELMAGQLAAVLGTGQTKYVAKRQDVSMNGLVREAIDKALADSGGTFDDIDAVVVGKAPDFFEG